MDVRQWSDQWAQASQIPAGTAAALRALAAGLADVAAPIEGSFTVVGGALGEALTVMDGVAEDFRRLSALLENADGVNAVTTLTRARQDTLELAANAQRMLGFLSDLDQSSVGLEHLLATLSRIIGEITALATNAKVQAAQIRTTSVDFSVFNQEIDRLHGLANSTTQQASDRLTALRAAIATAHQTANQFHADNARDLDAIGARLKASLQELSARRATARDSTRKFSARVSEISARTAQCIIGLQAGDLTRQRLEHIGHALDLLAAMQEPTAGAATDMDWLAELSEERKAALLAAVCDLQAQQYARTNHDFTAQIQGLRGNLQALARDAEAIATDARRLFQNDDGDRSFVGAVAADVDRATQLLNSYRHADERIREQIILVSDGFAAMKRGVTAINSIDADMRIMGLNTTFKCARLGEAGKALGVVAQELRACSRRTEEASRAIAEAIGGATAQASSLNAHSARDHESAAELTACMAESMAALDGLEGEQKRALTGLTAHCGKAAALLTKTAQSLTLEQRLDAFGTDLAQRLSTIIAIVPHHASVDSVREDVLRMLAGKYTMASERIIHDLFADGDAGPTAQADDGGDVDFF